MMENKGKIVQVSGPVVDVEFADGNLPRIKDALYVMNNGKKCVMEVSQHIGDNVVIGAGSVVTKDIPSNVIAVGNPCRVLREITEDDRQYYFKDRRFDVDDYIAPVNVAELT